MDAAKNAAPLIYNVIFVKDKKGINKLMAFIVSFITALIWHFFFTRLWLSSVGSTITTLVIIVSLLTTAGHPPSLTNQFYLDITIVTVIAFTISVLVGYTYTYARQQRNG